MFINYKGKNSSFTMQKHGLSLLTKLTSSVMRHTNIGMVEYSVLLRYSCQRLKLESDYEKMLEKPKLEDVPENS